MFEGHLLRAGHELRVCNMAGWEAGLAVVFVRARVRARVCALGRIHLEFVESNPCTWI